MGIMLMAMGMLTPAMALDEDSAALNYIDPASDIVIAVDMDQFNDYTRAVGREWRDADLAHYFGGLQSISDLFTKKSGKPDIWFFIQNLDGVQAISIDHHSTEPLMVFSAGSESELNLLSDYMIAYMLETRYWDSISEIEWAIHDYWMASRDMDGDDEYGDDDDENGDMDEMDDHDMGSMMGAQGEMMYPESLDALIEDGYLDAMPLNPFTGEPIQVVPEGETSLGNVSYSSTAHGYLLTTYNVGGYFLRDEDENNWVAYDDLEAELRKLERMHDFEKMGFTANLYNGWHFISRDDGEHVFGFGGNHLLFGTDLERLQGAVDRSMSAEHFMFDDPEGWDISDAFIRQQANLTTIMDNMDEMLPPEVPEAMVGPLLEGIGLDALLAQHDAVWLERGNVKVVRRLTLSGESEDSLLGTLLNAEPANLMTASNGPFNLVGEYAFANPSEYLSAIMDYAITYILPMAMEEMGMGGSDEMDPSMMLGMMGLGDVDNLGLDELYVLLTESAERKGGYYVPGLVMIWKSDNPELAQMDVDLIDSLGFMVPDWPLVRGEYSDENAATWDWENEVCPITPTVAWTDGWLVESLFREDALTAVEALEDGDLFSESPYGMANSRLYMNRQQLMDAAADVFYLCPEGEVAAAGFVFSLAGELSDSNERLYSECVHTDNYVEMTTEFSLGIFEDLLPSFTYIMRAVDSGMEF